MWKNNFNRTDDLDIYYVYEVKGANLDRLLNTLKKRGVELYNVKKYGSFRLRLWVKIKSCQNFFAITKELCYNTTKIGEKGKARFLLSAYRSIGLMVGALLFIFISVLFSDVILDFSYTGTGAVCKHQVQEYLYENGVTKYSRFSSINVERLEDAILANNENLSFVSCKKSGNTLKIELVLAKEKTPVLKGDVKSFNSDCDGVVKDIKVYRGTPLVKVNDVVKKGDLLVDGFMLVKEQRVDINVIASVTIECQEIVEYFSYKDNDTEMAIIFAEQQFDNNLIQKSQVTKSKDGDVYKYTVSVTYLKVLVTG